MKRLLFNAFATGLLASSLTVNLQAADWSQYRGSAGTGISSESVDSTQAKAATLSADWKSETPLGFSSFAIADGRAFTVIAKDDSEVTVALDADSGKTLWEVPMGSSKYKMGGGNAGAKGNGGGDGPRSTPAIDGDKVYVYDSYMVLRCLDAKTGKLVWQQDVLEDYFGRQIRWLNASSPVIVDDIVIVSGGGKGKSFLAFNKTTGEEVWTSGDETITHATPVIGNLGGKDQVVFFVQSGLVGVDYKNGKELWRGKFPFSVSTAASPVIDGNFIYCSAGYGVGASLFEVDLSGSEPFVKQRWFKSNELMNHWSTPVLHNGHLYGLFEFKKYGTAPLQCVELATGEIKWKERGFGPGNCILVGETLVVLSDAGEVVLVDADPSEYKELSRSDVLEGKCWSTPAYSDGSVFVRSTVEAAKVPVAK